MRALAVTGPEPTPLVPDLPTVAASGVPGFVLTSWWGVLGPAGMPQPIVTRLNTELVRILKTEDVKKRFAVLGVDAANSTPEEFASLIRSEITKYAKLLKSVGIEPM